MKELSEVTALVVDHGLHLPLARHLGKTYERVLYWSDFDEGCPSIENCVIGDGFEEVERCDKIFDALPDVDLCIFPDIGHDDLQRYLVKQGMPVWGSRSGDSLEIKREMFHKILGEVGLEVPKFTKVKGLENLRVFLKDKENKFIKVSRYRGSFETCKFRNYDTDEKMLDKWKVQFGPLAELINFLVFDEIDTNLELGGDTYNIDGQWPRKMLNAFEKKDEGLFAAVTDTEDMPEQVREVMAAFAPILKDYGYRNAWSMEIRSKDDQSWFIDPTCRYPNPATASQCAAYRNVAEIIWHGAQGQMVQPEVVNDYVIECALNTEGEQSEWGKVGLPEELESHVHVSNCCMVDGAYCWPVTETRGTMFGFLVAEGNTIPEVISLMQKRIELLPEGVTAKSQAIYDLLKEIHESEANGIQWSDDAVPEPETVLEQS